MYKKTLQNLQQSKFIAEFFTSKAGVQFIRYLITGFSSFGLETIIYLALSRKAQLIYPVAKAIAYFIVFWFNFVVNRVWSFESRMNLFKQLALYTPLSLFNLFVVYKLMDLLSIVLKINDLVSHVLVAGTIIIWNFIIYKKVIYK